MINNGIVINNIKGFQYILENLAYIYMICTYSRMIQESKALRYDCWLMLRQLHTSKKLEKNIKKINS